MQVCKLDRERIGRIRNQENYSFVELFKDDVDDVIAELKSAAKGFSGSDETSVQIAGWLNDAAAALESYLD